MLPPQYRRYRRDLPRQSRDHSVDDVPGRVEIAFFLFKEGDPPQVVDGKVLPKGLTITEWRNVFGGDEGNVTDPARGQPHHVSLKPWAQENPDTTYLRIDFYFTPDRPLKPEHTRRFGPPPWRQ